MVLEARLQNCNELAEFNPSSLNTIRVVTIRTNDDIVVLGSFLRMGRKGAIVDNAHNGGIFAHVDVSNGVVDSNAVDVDGHEYESHPDSGKKIHGYQIPMWDKIVETCKAAMAVNNRIKVCGWDVCINAENQIELIEGNHGPDIDVMQSTIKVGMRKRIEELYNIKIK